MEKPFKTYDEQLSMGFPTDWKKKALIKIV